ncbi:hypothetical protein FJTKL_14874 [Diaporthe vaccinii]|uniref:Uncharacterized protein n=1 Tax=Diaporthe vaccinii TaxID=105482 RepID=A0ABR4F8E7_9PEZI
MMYSDLLSNMCCRMRRSTTAPRLSTLDRKMTSIPRSISLSRIPELYRDSKTSPCPGGYHSLIGESKLLGTGRRESLWILGYRDWLKVRMSTLWPSYFLMMAAVSSLVLNEFIRMKGTLVPYVRFRYSTWRTERSRKDMPSRTSMTDLGPTQPIEVPRPPFSFRTASLFRKSTESVLARAS